jgi:hypothetical protein
MTPIGCNKKRCSLGGASVFEAHQRPALGVIFDQQSIHPPVFGETEPKPQGCVDEKRARIGLVRLKDDFNSASTRGAIAQADACKRQCGRQATDSPVGLFAPETRRAVGQVLSD